MSDSKLLSMVLELKRRTWCCAFCGSSDVRYSCFPTVRGFQVAECGACGAVAGVEKDSAEREYIFWSKYKSPCVSENSVQKPSEALDESLVGEIIEALA